MKCFRCGKYFYDGGYKLEVTPPEIKKEGRIHYIVVCNQCILEREKKDDLVIG